MNTRTPLAALFASVIAKEEAERAIAGADLLSKAEEAQYRRDAFSWALQCLAARDGWDIETLSHNVESNFPDLADDESYDIAEAALAQGAL